MAEPTDVIIPILQRIQSDVGELKRDVADVKLDVAEIKTTLGRHSEKLNEMNGYLSFSLNITARHTTEVDTLRDEIDAIKRRLATLERQN
jgi:predicted  nucleic acid-binding Zn-ribbon protein